MSYEVLDGTQKNTFQLGKDGPKVINNSGDFEFRDLNGASFKKLSGADPTIDDNLATKRYVDQEISAGIRCIILPITFAATQDSTTIIPQNSRILRTWLDVLVAYTIASTITIGNSANPTLLQVAADNEPDVIGTYIKAQNTLWGADLAVRVTVNGALAGSGFCIVEYVPVPGV
jgi:hypothetical protein